MRHAPCLKCQIFLYDLLGKIATQFSVGLFVCLFLLVFVFKLLKTFIRYGRGHHTFPVKSEMVNILGFVETIWSLLQLFSFAIGT